MADLWNQVSLTLFDVLLGWTLHLPRALALVVVAIVTALAITLTRKWTTDQDRLRRAAADARRLKELRRTARKAGDRDALARIQATQGQVAALKLKAELLPLLAVLLPIGLLATWAFHRLEFRPPGAGEMIEVAAYVPLSAEDDVLHVLPRAGVNAINGWVQPVRLVANPPSGWDRFWARIGFHEAKPLAPDAIAVWQLKAEAAPEAYRLTFRWKDRTFEHALLAGQSHYSPAVELHEDEQVTTVIRLPEVRLFGIPGLGPWLPAWIVGYLLVTIPLVPLLKRVLGVF